MGRIRARTSEEFEARRQEILDAAAHQLMESGYDAVTLATIATQTSVSRTSMYTYYERKEDVFVDLMIREYAELEQALTAGFAGQMARRGFCEALADLFIARPVLLKLLSLQLPVRDGRYSDDMMERFVDATRPFTAALRRVVRVQFPEAGEAAIDRFMVQFSMYANCFYVACHLPESQLRAMEATEYYGSIPDGRTICVDGLLLLCAELG